MRITTHPFYKAMSAAVAGVALLAAACAEPTSVPRSIAVGNGANADVVTSFPSPTGTLQQTINSGATIHYCAYDATTSPASGTFAGTDCATAAVDLTSALAAYNPGWSAPFAGTSWIGPTAPDAPSNQYVARPGSYEYVTTFTIPAGATDVSFQLETKTDNALVAYLNGTEIGRNDPLQDCTVEQQPNCNWNVELKITDNPATFNVGGSNTLRIDVVNTRIGEVISGTPTSSCAQGPQQTGVGGVPTPQYQQFLDGTWSVSDCLNPTGLDFTARVYFTPPPVILGDQGCSPGYWKNHSNWPAPYTPNEQFSAVFDNAFPGMTLLDVLSQGGGGLNSLGRHTVSALLDAQALGVIHYGLTAQQVIDMFNAVYPGTKDQYNTLADQFGGMEDVNGRTCPLN